MDTTGVCKTYSFKRAPPPEQGRVLADVLHRWRPLYTWALAQRSPWWRRAQGRSGSRFQQEAERKDLRGALPDDAATHSPVLQDVLARLDKTDQACFRRRQSGATPGFPGFQGKERAHAGPSTDDGNGARRANGNRVLCKRGRRAVRWSRLVRGVLNTVTGSREADGWCVCFSCDQVSMQARPTSGRAPGGAGAGAGAGAGGRKGLRATAEGEAVQTPRHSRPAAKRW